MTKRDSIIIRTAGRYKKLRPKRLPHFIKRKQIIQGIQIDYGKTSCLITKSDLTVGPSKCIRIITKRFLKRKCLSKKRKTEATK
jgi:hypothetical protein